jgi:hypothetical protein
MGKRISLKKYNKRIKILLKHPFFWFLTILGNGGIFIGSILLYEFESSKQQLKFIDYLLWSTGIITTVGYGSYMADSFCGKVTTLFLMLLGTLFVWLYMGFLVTIIITPELSLLEKEIHDVEKSVLGLKLENKDKSKDNEKDHT